MTGCKKVLRQVEYYFGDLNLQRDTFLNEEIKKDSDGWVSLETMMKVTFQSSKISLNFDIFRISLK